MTSTIGSSVETVSATDAAMRAGTLALAVARAATTSGTHRARVEAALHELVMAMDARLVACYVSGLHQAPRRVAAASSSVATDRAVAPLARRAAVCAAAQWRAGQESADGPRVTRQDIASPSTAETLVLTLETNHCWLGLVVIWHDAQTATGHDEVLREVAPLLALILPPLVDTAPVRLSAGDQRSSARRRNLCESTGAGQQGTTHAALAHALRNPLNTLGGFLEIVLSEQVGPLNERQRQFLEYARDSAARIATIVEQVG